MSGKPIKPFSRGYGVTRKDKKRKKKDGKAASEHRQWSAEDFAKAEARPDLSGLKRPEPPKPTRKSLIGLRIDNSTLEAFRRTGPGWQSRINQALRAAAEAQGLSAGAPAPVAAAPRQAAKIPQRKDANPRSRK